MLSALLVLLAFLLGVVAGRLSLLVVSDVEKAIAEAERQSVMYHLGPCEARPFDLSVEVDRG